MLIFLWEKLLNALTEVKLNCHPIQKLFCGIFLTIEKSLSQNMINILISSIACSRFWIRIKSVKLKKNRAQFKGIALDNPNLNNQIKSKAELNQSIIKHLCQPRGCDTFCSSTSLDPCLAKIRYPHLNQNIGKMIIYRPNTNISNITPNGNSVIITL